MYALLAAIDFRALLESPEPETCETADRPAT
jgi:hypothetical protein